MRVEILPALVRGNPDDFMECALLCFQEHQRGHLNAEKWMWEWLFRWAGMPV